MNKGDVVETITDKFLRNAPWRRTASWINDNADQMTAHQALVSAGLDWDVVQCDLHATVVAADGVTTVPVKGKVANVRVADNGECIALGVVSPSYTVVQNREIVDLVDGITYEAGAIYDAAGSLKNGKRIYIAAKMPNTVTVGGIDPYDTYIVITNGHDGSQALNVSVKHLRVLCMNGLVRAENLSSISLKHTRRMDVRVQQIRDSLNLIYRENEAFESLANDLLAVKVTDNEFWSMVNAMFPAEADATDRVNNAAERRREMVWDIYNGGTQENIRGTAWGAWQAFVEFADWSRPVRSRNNDNAEFVRAERQMLGKMDSFKFDALQVVTSV